ncbi:MAG: AAA family ATPase [Bacteroidaceae bacterium]|nr:AAA family ATPase [Bacteroidaceae bacterium]
MIGKEVFCNSLQNNFPFTPTLQQSSLFEELAEFICAENDAIFVLKGYAGTGKTTIVGTLVKSLRKIGMHAVLLAPTGRASNVMQSYSGHSATTIHKRIYRQKSITDPTCFVLGNNESKNTLFIVDEASMIYVSGSSGAEFGSGSLLDDLMEYVYNGQGCRLMLIGDSAQLPPVGQTESPALNAAFLEKDMFRKVMQFTLTQVMRQEQQSGILYNATNIREIITGFSNEDVNIPSFKYKLKGFNDISVVSSADLIETISSSYSRYGIDQTVVICRSNKRAWIYNNGIRNSILGREEKLSAGDLLMVAKNNYYWTESIGPDADVPCNFIANGELVRVRKVRGETELYGFRFAKITIEIPYYDNYEMDVNILLETLSSPSPSLTQERSEELFRNVMEDYSGIKRKAERYKKIRENKYFNALQVKYGYAITCHKAQGGQWNSVFIDQGYLAPDATPDMDYYRWLYTALTRATGQVYLVNCPADSIDPE